MDGDRTEVVIWISRAEVGKLRSAGETGLKAYFYKVLLKQPYSFVYILHMAAFSRKDRVEYLDRDCMTCKA